MKSAASGTLPLLNSYILSCTAQFWENFQYVF
jgi:hypothetical protein